MSAAIQVLVTVVLGKISRILNSLQMVSGHHRQDRQPGQQRATGRRKHSQSGRRRQQHKRDRQDQGHHVRSRGAAQRQHVGQDQQQQRKRHRKDPSQLRQQHEMAASFIDMEASGGGGRMNQNALDVFEAGSPHGAGHHENPGSCSYGTSVGNSSEGCSRSSEPDDSFVTRDDHCPGLDDSMPDEHSSGDRAESAGRHAVQSGGRGLQTADGEGIEEELSQQSLPSEKGTNKKLSKAEERRMRDLARERAWLQAWPDESEE